MYEEPRQDNVLLIYMARAHGGALFDFSGLWMEPSFPGDPIRGVSR